ncbi:hypothetical protein LZ578_10640 [Jeotgalibaca sp. MA1X17-3]|uniref:hypothetical protein n=1 Tax=Jeotgalibaca sp. MA1X17-3 TaxID=2908211 RepID=UPI001F47FF09|nr:hypothetical protein [Jeotgalibaca sp. MA1X17-3]UJF15412.1 hypothetical protein LZ578_10640 [Jeotgalibaca sp. MA1X17-3]
MLLLFLYMISYQKYYSNQLHTETETISNYSRMVKTDGTAIKIYKDNKWETIQLKGVELSSFHPGYGRFQTSIPKKEIIGWLENIGEMNANVIKVPYIQPPAFYSALYDYNLNREKPLYVIHEILLDEKAILKEYDAFDKEILTNLKKDIKSTINVVNGQALLLSNKRNHRGLYLKDISKYSLGFIIGTNTNAELVSLSNVRYGEKTEYVGEYFSLQNGNAFEVFISEILDYAATYEIEKYERSSLLSYLTTLETDSFEYKHESNVTKQADIDIGKIVPQKGDNLFVSYKYHPNSSDFLDFEYTSSDSAEATNQVPVFSKHLERLSEFYELPLVISDTGLSSSRAKSKVDLNDGFDRGGFSEKEQGEKIVELLEGIQKVEAAGVLLSSWQDDWTKLTSFGPVEDYLDENNSSYWHDLQSSDESFGFLKFESGKEIDQIYVDGNFSDWENVKTIVDEKGIKLKVKSDLSNLYLLVEKEDWSLTEDTVYIGLDITPLSGSKTWEKEAEFSNQADFVIKLQGYNESRVVVNKRYNLFNYLYKYYSNIIEKESVRPDEDSDQFEAIYLLNRKKFYLKDSNQVLSPLYYETGHLTHGINHPENPEFDSLADFHKEGDQTEIKIPWSLINVKDPLEGKSYGDFYLNGVSSQQDLKQIGFSIHYKGNGQNIITEDSKYKMENLKSNDYFERLKDSYYIVKDYWDVHSEIE